MKPALTRRFQLGWRLQCSCVILLPRKPPSLFPHTSHITSVQRATLACVRRPGVAPTAKPSGKVSKLRANVAPARPHSMCVVVVGEHTFTDAV